MEDTDSYPKEPKTPSTPSASSCLATSALSTITPYFSIDENARSKLGNMERIEGTSPRFMHQNLKHLSDDLSPHSIPFYREHPFLANPDRSIAQPSAYDVTVVGGDRPSAKVIQSQLDGSWTKHSNGCETYKHRFAIAEIRTHRDFGTLLRKVAEYDNIFLLRSTPFVFEPLWKKHRRLKLEGRTDGQIGTLADIPVKWVSLDVEGVSLPDHLSYDDPDDVVAWLMQKVMPPCFRNVSCTWNASAGAGTYAPREVRFHIYLFLTEPIHSQRLYELFKGDRKTFGMIDAAGCRSTQVILTANPTIHEDSRETVDPLKGRRVGFFQGTHEEADLTEAIRSHDSEIAQRRKRIEAKKTANAYKRQKAQHCAIHLSSDSKNSSSELGTGDYADRWRAIARYECGGANGYFNAIYKFLFTALRSGERNHAAIIRHVQEYVREVAENNGDLREYTPRFEDYLATETLQRRLNEAEQFLSSSREATSRAPLQNEMST